MSQTTQTQALVQVLKQHGLTFMPDTATHKARMPIKSESSNRLYTVSFRPALSQWECSCPGWCMKKPGKPRSCKHLRNMAPALSEIASILKLA